MVGTRTPTITATETVQEHLRRLRRPTYRMTGRWWPTTSPFCDLFFLSVGSFSHTTPNPAFVVQMLLAIESSEVVVADRQSAVVRIRQIDTRRVSFQPSTTAFGKPQNFGNPARARSTPSRPLQPRGQPGNRCCEAPRSSTKCHAAPIGSFTSPAPFTWEARSDFATPQSASNRHSPPRPR